MPTTESTEVKRRRAARRVPLKVFFEEKTFKGARESKRRVPGNSARQLTLFEEISANLA